ncbi:hypothetical protein [Guptibacillus hwajinpoensis]|uniref:Uncharacterized protein YcfL n=1 Tax=Guptibacillus hwajinpoensis TaxID=208199 RepID=A0ABU0K2I5_9BACL|nr:MULTISPECIES: hypothetical protein [Alkalihalobacillus]MDP4551589.1 hypothetical protein [Alkalihalobacillus macyae]MDQ0482367.1 uncharacterized protein YcfL [Alkalihalobacillus hemicentroti]
MNQKKFMLKIATSFVAVMLITACSSNEGNNTENGNNSMNNGSNTEEPATNENSTNSAE